MKGVDYMPTDEIPRVNLQRLREMRKKANMTQAEVSAYLGYKSSLGYHYLETGRCSIKAEQLLSLSKLFGVPVDQIIDNAVISKPTKAM